MTGIKEIKCLRERFSNTEIRVEIGENVRNRDMLLFQTGSYNMETGYSKRPSYGGLDYD